FVRKMSQQRSTSLDDLRALFKTLEEENEAVEKLKIQYDLIIKSGEMYEMCANIEESYTEYLTKNLEDLKACNESDEQQLINLQTLRCISENSNISQIIDFSEGLVSDYIEKSNAEMSHMENERKAAVEKFFKSVPLVCEYEKAKANYEQLLLQKESLSREREVLKEQVRRKQLVDNLLLIRNIVDMATIVLKQNAAKVKEREIAKSSEATLAAASTSTCENTIDGHGPRYFNKSLWKETLTHKPTKPIGIMHDEENSDHAGPGTSTPTNGTEVASQNKKWTLQRPYIRSNVKAKEDEELSCDSHVRDSMKSEPSAELLKMRKPKEPQRNNVKTNNKDGSSEASSSADSVKISTAVSLKNVSATSPQKMQKPKGKVTFELYASSSSGDLGENEASCDFN
ncbi:hypothetical protein Bhyg_02366, partial [Pseudolycoriella hygida]